MGVDPLNRRTLLVVSGLVAIECYKKHHFAMIWSPLLRQTMLSAAKSKKQG